MRQRLRQGVAILLCALALVGEEAFAQLRGNAVDIEFERIGLGGASFRPGDWTPIRLRLTADPGGQEQALPVWVQWELPDANGDIAEYSRVLTLTRGQPIPVWLYAPLPPDARPESAWTIRIFEHRDGQRRAEIGGRRISPLELGARAEPITAALIGVIGDRGMGLGGYGVRFDVYERPITAHEETRVTTGVQPAHLPDRWEALRGYEAIVWGGPMPQELTADTARALREYIRRGGHLVIVLPEDANPWRFGTPGQTLLEDLLPGREPRRDDGVHIAELLPILSKAQGTAANFTVSIRVFKELNGRFDAMDNHYEPLIAMSDGRVVAIQRTFGHGRITILGVDVSAARLAAVPLSNGSMGLPQADVFWNRILGRRVDTPTASELEATRQAAQLATSATARDLGGGGLFYQQIAMSAAAGIGLLLALLLFATYWILAGPGGFAMLKARKQVQHSWLMFVAAAGLFTAVAWGAVGAIRIKHPQVQHVTYLDHIARPAGVSRSEDPQLQRAASWFSLYTPGYGHTTLAIDSQVGQRDLLTTWKPPAESLLEFHNIDRYTIDVGERPARYAIPSRATATPMYAHWIGGLDPQWGGMIREHPDDPLRTVLDAVGNERELAGALIHDLPGTLQDVTIIWVRNMRMPPRRYDLREGREMPFVPLLRSGAMLNSGFFWRQNQWAPGTVIDLRTQDYAPRSRLEGGIDDRYLSEYRRQITLPTALDERTSVRYMEMLGIFNQLSPPQYLKRRDTDPDPQNAVFQRRVGRELDLSPWFTRPCVIVIGYLRDSDLPIPLEVDGRRPRSRGVTVVRWVYPLPLDERIAFMQRDTEEYDDADEPLDERRAPVEAF